MSTKTNIPNSDRTARKRSEAQDEARSDGSSAVEPQTSNKSGKHSSVEKLAASRPEFAAAPGAKAKPGSFGDGRAKKGGEASASTKGLAGRPGEVSEKVKKTKGK